MIGGLFIYNHKGEVLISRVYRDDIGDSGLWLPTELRDRCTENLHHPAGYQESASDEGRTVPDHQPGDRADWLAARRHQVSPE
uniref:Adaptor-related protein complex 2, mu 1 subunit n=1 Tax=Mus musculus TaxID=10090 RepID=A0A338P798_MOUSE